MTDPDLLQQYANSGSQAAFAELVSRHGDWIYSAALRMVHRRDWAEDVTQAVFLVLAQHAKKLKTSTLNGWLFKVTRHCAFDLLRGENRRKNRERQAAIMTSQTREAAGESTWDDIAPILEKTVGRLRTADREAVLLRFYQRKSMSEVGDALGVSEDAARKRVAKALEKLRSLMSVHGVLLPAAGVAITLLSEQTTHAAPPGLGASCLPGAATTSAVHIAQGVNHMMLALKLKIAAVAIVVMALIPVGAWISLRVSTADQPDSAVPARTPAAIDQPAPSSPAPSPAAVASNITVDSDFDCGTPVDAVVDSPNHVGITLDARQVNLDWWMFRLSGVAGKTVTIDVKLAPNAKSGFEKWETLTPVYGDAADLNDPATYATGPLNVYAPTFRHGIGIPTTEEQAWHYIKDSSLVTNRHFKMTQAFTTDSVYIAGRVPYPPGYSAQFINNVAANPRAKVIDLDQTPGGRAIRVVQIGATDEASQATKPCVIICGGEQAYEPDGMWTCQGCIEFLLSDSAQAKALRDQCVFFIIPMLDPDGTAGSNGNFVGSFRARAHNPISIAYANWLQARVLAGGRIDLVLELHSLQSQECQHLQRVEVSGDSADRHAAIEAFQKIITRQFETDRLTVTQNTLNGGRHSPFRFSGWVSKRFGALDIIYEVNAQASIRHLTLSQLKDTGRLFAQAVGDFFASDRGAQLMASVDEARANRQTAWNGNPATNPSQNAIESEEAAAAGSGTGGGNR